ncbi:MAG: carbon storage regulator [Actinomycetaceae bacterium]|nr:carbon storage regulator [Actinomycetaceae bacterium]
MLVLTRRDGETIMIGDDVEITVVECHRDAVRIGIDAPRSTKIRRGELLDPARIREPKDFKKARLEAAKKEREQQQTDKQKPVKTVRVSKGTPTAKSTKNPRPSKP